MLGNGSGFFFHYVKWKIDLFIFGLRWAAVLASEHRFMRNPQCEFSF